MTQRAPTARSLTVLSLSATTLLSVAVAATTSVRFFINGRAAANAISVNGTTYVPVAALKAAGLNVTVTGGRVDLNLPAGAGGQNQVAAVSGCLGETLFNGVWRFRVTDVRAVPSTYNSRPGFEITAEVRNATGQSLDLTGTGFGLTNVNLAFADGTTTTVESVAPNREGWDHNRAVMPAGAYTMKAQVPGSGAPTKLVYLRAGNVKAGLPWNTPDPAFRVDLTCRK